MLELYWVFTEHKDFNFCMMIIPWGFRTLMLRFIVQDLFHYPGPSELCRPEIMIKVLNVSLYRLNCVHCWELRSWTWDLGMLVNFTGKFASKTTGETQFVSPFAESSGRGLGTWVCLWTLQESLLQRPLERHSLYLLFGMQVEICLRSLDMYVTQMVQWRSFALST